MTVPEHLRELDEQLAQVRREKQAAIDAQDFTSAAALRDAEKDLLTRKLRQEQDWAAGVDPQAVIAENHRLHAEVEHLRGMLRQHEIDPNGGTAQSP